MTNKFTFQATIGYSGTDHDLLLSPASLAVYLQDLAINHSESLGYSLEIMAQMHRGWAITNWHYQMRQYPRFGETITFATWADTCKRMQAQRSFEVTDESGNLLCTAVSRWVFMDLERRRPTIIPEDMQQKFSCNLAPVILEEKYQMPKAQEQYLFSQRLFKVRRRDTDTNGHTNNTKYLEWACDNIPDEIYNQYKKEDIRIVYRKECYQNSLVISKCYLKKLEDNAVEVISFFLDGNDRKTIFAEVAAIWRKKK